MVFQNYAIFPHMNVFDNVAYGLVARKVGKAEIKKRVMDALEIVELAHLKDRAPANLSGGQQQRIALARAIVIRPKLLLMDEPLSNLDAKLRVQMRNDIKRLQKELNITTIYVTHDQEEALAISDRIAVMKDGIVQQIDIPEKVYIYPNNRFVANFIGTSNFIEGNCEMKQDETAQIKILNNNFILPVKRKHNGKVQVSVRPEDIKVSTENSSENLYKGVIELSLFLGQKISYLIRLTNGQTIEVHSHPSSHERVLSENQEVYLDLGIRRSVVYDSQGNEVIYSAE